MEPASLYKPINKRLQEKETARQHGIKEAEKSSTRHSNSTQHLNPSPVIRNNKSPLRPRTKRKDNVCVSLHPRHVPVSIYNKETETPSNLPSCCKIKCLFPPSCSRLWNKSRQRQESETLGWGTVKGEHKKISLHAFLPFQTDFFSSVPSLPSLFQCIQTSCLSKFPDFVVLVLISPSLLTHGEALDLLSPHYEEALDLLPPLSARRRLRTASRWLEKRRCVSNFCAVISGPGVYNLDVQSRQRMRGSHAYLTPSGSGWICTGSSVIGSRYEYFIMASKRSPSGYFFSRPLRAWTSHSGGFGYTGSELANSIRA